MATIKILTAFFFLSVAQAFATQAPAVVKYQCPMHPQIVREEPGTCPICHMTLEKVELEPAEPAGSTAKVEGKAAFNLSIERQQAIGVKTAVAGTQTLTRTLRLPGRVNGAGVLAQVMELDAGWLRPGQKARLIGPDFSETEAVVREVDNNLDSLTRSFGASLAPKSRMAWMKQGVFCEVRVTVELGKRLALPAEAVLDTGKRQVAFVAVGSSRFEPRQLRTGQVGDGLVEVLDGVKAGERVVVSANFLIDSESQFKAAIR